MMPSLKALNLPTACKYRGHDELAGYTAPEDSKTTRQEGTILCRSFAGRERTYLADYGEQQNMNIATLSRIVPFSLNMVFIAVEMALRTLVRKGLLTIPDPYLICLYPLKVLSVALVLFLFQHSYA